jgi:capsule polysaccharide export protein KpsE/RkpR
MLDMKSTASDRQRGLPRTTVEYLALFLKWRRPILWFSSSTAVLTAAYLWFFVPNVYESKATMKPAITATLSGGGLSSLLNVKGVGDIGNMLGMGQSRSELEQYGGLMHGAGVLSEIVRRYDLQREFGEKYFEDAVKEFNDHVKTSVERETQIMTLSVEDTSAARAQRICTMILELADSVNRSLSRRTAQMTREYLDLRYEKCVKDLASAEDSLRVFQIRYRVLDMKDQATASVKIAAELEGHIAMKEVQADLAARTLGHDDADARRLANEVEQMKSQRRALDQGLDLKTAFNSIIPFASAPQVGLEYFRRFREVEIQQRLFALLFPLIEQARVDERRNTVGAMVLDPPSLPERKLRPKRTLITGAAFVVGILIGFLFVLCAEEWEYLRGSVKAASTAQSG